MLGFGGWYYVRKSDTVPGQQNKVVHQVPVPELSSQQSLRTESNYLNPPKFQWREFQNLQVQFKYPKTDYIEETAIFNGGVILFDAVNASAFVIHIFDKNITFPTTTSSNIIWQKLLDMGILGNLDCELAYSSLVIPKTNIENDCYNHQNWDYNGDLKKNFPYEELPLLKIGGQPAIGMAVTIPAKDEGFIESFYFVDLGTKYGILATETGSSLGTECPPAYPNQDCPVLDSYFDEILNSVKFLN